MPDMVNSPSHYQLDGLEAIDIIKAALTPEEYRGYLKGNSLKYILREPFKGNSKQDVEKAQWYLSRYHGMLPVSKEGKTMSVKKYRKKPVRVEAVQLTKSNLADVAKWCGADIGYTFGSHAPSALDVHTPEGTMPVYIGDFIIKSIQGEFYPCKPDFFAATYEEDME